MLHDDGLETWESCRKRARKLESEIDVKLSAFGKLCDKYDGHLSRSLDEETLQAKSNELERLLQELEGINHAMESLIGNTDSHSHTLSRHRDILREYIQEKEKWKAVFATLRRTGSSETTPLMGIQVQGTTGMLLRERATIHNASYGIDEVIHQATAIADEVKSQGNLFQRMSTQLTDLSMRYPLVHSLLRTISRRKSRDAWILVIVIATCLALTVGYVIWK